MVGCAAGTLVAPIVVLAVAGAAHAAPPDAETIDAARTSFAEGNTHFQARRWSEALKAFERSHGLVSSPNTQLMIARCHRELGRRVEAATAFSDAALEARSRVARGESRYTPTVDAATTEGNAVRAQLGTIQVKVERPDPAVTLLVDRKSVALSPEGEATILHEPGSVSVAVVEPGGAEQRQTVTVPAGVAVQMVFAPSEPKVAPPPPPAPIVEPTAPRREPPAPERRYDPPSWVTPATITAGAVTVAGLGLFIGFGASSQGTYDDLVARCRAPSGCGTAEDRADAASGKDQQTIANVALGAAITGAVATVVLLFLALNR